MHRAAWVVLAGFAAGCTAQAQARPGKTCIPDVTSSVMRLDIVTKDLPYNATRVFVCEEKLGDGTVVKGKRTFLEWRDSQGRVRRESRDTSFEGHELYNVQVVDPVEHVLWQWDVGKDSPRQAIETKYNMRNEYTQFPLTYQFGNYVHAQGPRFKDVRLRPKWVNGVYATGDRITQICGPGENGNNTKQPVTTTDETWLSVDLGLIVQSLQNTANGSSEVEDLLDIDRSEPDPSLFKPPTGYQILVSPKTIGDPGLHQVKLKPRTPRKGAVVLISPGGTPVAKQ
jgi:hypothetical protein